MKKIQLFLLCILALTSRTTLTAQEISVFFGATTNAASQHPTNSLYSFADTSVGQFSAPQTFTIKNDGVVPLTGLALSKSGSNATDFILGSLDATTLAPQASTTFTVTFGPTAGAFRDATV